MMLTCAGLYLLRKHFNALLYNNENDDDDRITIDTEQIDSEDFLLNHRQIYGQIPRAIRDFSSQYGSNHSDSYVVSNICSNPEIFPAYGDSTHALVFRTYGPWWINLPSYREWQKYFTRWENHFTSKDFLEIEYDEFVYQCVSLNIYETYNPGALQVVYLGEEDQQGNVTWHRVWTYPQSFSIILSNDDEMAIENGRQQMKDLFSYSTDSTSQTSDHSHIEQQNMSKIFTYHSSPPAARIPRITKIPLKNRVAFPTRLVRLEFDHSTVQYYTEIDTIILYGETPPPAEKEPDESLSNTIEIELEEKTEESISLTELPFDILCIICSYLDFRSLVRLSSTCSSFHKQCLDPLQFRSVNFQPYWNGINNDSIENFFLHRCAQTRHLSLAWTRSIQYSSFSQLINVCSNHLMNLNLACCQYLTGQYLKILVNQCPTIELLNLENCLSLTNIDFLPLKYFTHLRSLNVYRTKIDYRTLLPLIENNRKTLEHLNLGACQKLVDAVGIVRLLFSRCSNLRSIDLWRTHGLTANGFLSLVGLSFDVGEEKRRILNLSLDEQEELTLIYSSVNMPLVLHSIAAMRFLSEIDLGWTDLPPGFLRSFLQQIGNSLEKLFLTACRRVNNDDFLSISEHCPQLRQVDLLGSSIILDSTVESILKSCTKLQFLDLSFCDKISDEIIVIWIGQYKASIKRSYSPMTSNDVTVEFP